MQPLEHAPDLTGATGWRNVDRPVDLRHDLAGQVIVLVFFAPECIHSRQALATAALLDARFATRPLSVVGVCSPPPGLAADADALLAETGARMPVALDAERQIWSAYGAQAWPALAVIDGTGRVRYFGSGEPNLDALVDALKTLLAEVEYGGLGYSVPPVPRSATAPSAGPLAWPDGLAVDPARGLAFVADTAQHRLVALDLVGMAPAQVLGIGGAGASDGEAEQAAFAAPRGLAFDAASGRLLIADSANHTLRALGRDGRVGTLLGAGARGRDVVGGGRGVGQTLAWPWATACGDDGVVWIAVAGTHQVWAMAVDGEARARVGTGLAGCVDGPAAQARLCAPRGLALGAGALFVADAGNHAIRRFDLATGIVTTLVGRGPHEPGDVDGAFAAARLRTPSALWWDGAALLVADTGNGKVKRLDLAKGEITTLPTGVALTQPSAFAAYADQLLVLDRARPGVAELDLVSGAGRWLDFAVPVAAANEPTVRLRAHADCTVKLRLTLPRGASVHPEVGIRVTLANVDAHALAFEMLHDAVVEGERAVVRGVTTGAIGSGRVSARVSCFVRHGVGLAAHPHEETRVACFTLDAEAPTMANWD
jgi:DNA-binding beta-propeller fold protein YncE